MYSMLGSLLRALWRYATPAPLAVLAALTLIISGCGGGSGSPLATTASNPATCNPDDPATAAECGTSYTFFTMTTHPGLVPKVQYI